MKLIFSAGLQAALLGVATVSSALPAGLSAFAMDVVTRNQAGIVIPVTTRATGRLLGLERV